VGSSGSRSRPISRVLSPPCGGDDHSSRRPVAWLLKLPTRTLSRRAAEAGAPLRRRRRRSLFGIAPDGVFHAMPHHWAMRCALTAPFHHHRRHPEGLRSGCLFSVALSVGSPRLVVNQHPALWSSDFPLVETAQKPPRPAIVWPTPSPIYAGRDGLASASRASLAWASAARLNSRRTCCTRKLRKRRLICCRRVNSGRIRAFFT
jgi:hypothetical protein